MGRAKYATDIVLPGMLYAKVVRSPHPHARIVDIDTSKAERLPGVKAVNGHQRYAGASSFGIIPHTKDQVILPYEKVGTWARR